MKRKMKLASFPDNQNDFESKKSNRSIWLKGVITNLSIAEGMVDFSINTVRALADGQRFQGKAEGNDLQSIFDMTYSTYKKLVDLDAEIKNLQRNNII